MLRILRVVLKGKVENKDKWRVAANQPCGC